MTDNAIKIIYLFSTFKNQLHMKQLLDENQNLVEKKYSVRFLDTFNNRSCCPILILGSEQLVSIALWLTCGSKPILLNSCYF